MIKIPEFETVFAKTLLVILVITTIILTTLLVFADSFITATVALLMALALAIVLAIRVNVVKIARSRKSLFSIFAKKGPPEKSDSGYKTGKQVCRV